MNYVLTVMVSLITVAYSAGQSTTLPNAEDEKLIGNVMDSFVDAWNKHDANAFANVFSEDADFTNVRGAGAHSRAEVEKFHATTFATLFKDSHQTLGQRKTRFIKPDVAAVDVWWEMTGAKTPDGKDIPLRKGLLNLVMTKTGNNWLITVMHNMDLPAAP